MEVHGLARTDPDGLGAPHTKPGLYALALRIEGVLDFACLLLAALVGDPQGPRKDDCPMGTKSHSGNE